jgi:hypothetical protein
MNLNAPNVVVYQKNMLKNPQVSITLLIVENVGDL